MPYTAGQLKKVLETVSDDALVLIESRHSFHGARAEKGYAKGNRYDQFEIILESNVDPEDGSNGFDTEAVVLLDTSTG